MKSYSIALIPGDGIGRDVTAAAWSVLETATKHAGFALTKTEFPWSCKFYKETGRMMPQDGIETLRGFDAILLGAVGWPAEVPDSVSLHGLLLPIRKAFVQYANIRPHRLLPRPMRPHEIREEHRARRQPLLPANPIATPFYQPRCFYMILV